MFKYNPEDNFKMLKRQTLSNLTRRVGNVIHNVSLEQIHRGEKPQDEFIVSYTITEKILGMFSKIRMQNIHNYDRTTLEKNHLTANMDTALNEMYNYYCKVVVQRTGLTFETEGEARSTDNEQLLHIEEKQFDTTSQLAVN